MNVYTFMNMYIYIYIYIDEEFLSDENSSLWCHLSHARTFHRTQTHMNCVVRGICMQSCAHA